MKTLALGLLLFPAVLYGQGIEASKIRKTTFAKLGNPTEGQVREIPDGTAGSPCTSGSTKVWAYANGSSWICTTHAPSGGGGTGDVVGPVSATDNALPRFDSTTGKLIQNSLITVDDSGSVNIPSGQLYKINNVALAKGDVGLSALTNDTQTKAAIVPNTAPSAGQFLAGNAGGTAYLPVSLSQDCTLLATGAITCLKTNNVLFSVLATTTPGTGVATALGVNIGSVGAPVLFNGALGTPSSGTVTNLIGTASININGTVGATTPNTGAFTAGTFSSTITQTSNSASAFVTGPNGATNPVLKIDNSVASQADGVSITGGAAGVGTTFQALSSGSNSGFTFTPKGTGRFALSTGGFMTVTPGSASAVEYALGNSAAVGMYTSGGGVIVLSTNNHISVQVGDDNLRISGNGSKLDLGSTGSSPSLTNLSDVGLRINPSGALTVGAADSATPTAQTISTNDVVAGTSNTAGVDFTIAGSQGTGTGAGGSLVFQTAPAGSTGTSQNTLATALTLDSNGGIMANTSQRCFLAADQTSTSTTFANINNCTINVTSGNKYTFRTVLYLSDSTAADGAKIDFNGGAATATNFRVHCTAFDTALGLSSQGTALSTAYAASTFSGAGLFECYGEFEPSSSSTFIPRFAQNAHTVGTLTLARGSHVIFERMP